MSDTLADAEREHVLRVLRACGGSRSLAALRLGISLRGLQYMLARYQRAGVAVPPASGWGAKRRPPGERKQD